jgi:glutamine cyclotransferase
MMMMMIGVVAFLLIATVIIPVDDNDDASNDTTGSTMTNRAAATDHQGNDRYSHRRRMIEEVTSSTRTQMGTYRLLQTVPHDRSAFTQGLITVQDPTDGTLKFYEGTGVNGQSQLRLVEMETGTVLAQHSLPFRYFGEGITHYISSHHALRLIQITWQQQTAFDYEIQSNQTSTSNTSSKTTFQAWVIRMTQRIRSSQFCRRRRQRLRMCRTSNNDTNVIQADDTVVRYPLTVPPPNATIQYSTTTNEGWGITYSQLNHRLYVTDGSSYLHTWNVTTKKEITKVPVRYQYSTMDAPLDMNRLNELEYDPYTNTILANVWLKDIIVRIDIATGFILTIYDLSTLYTNRVAGSDVLNGIALTYDAIQLSSSPPFQNNNNSTTGIATDEIWVTGKYWPNMYRIQLIDP